MKISLETNNKIKNKKKIETSKALLLSLIILTYIFVIFTCVIICIFKDISPLIYLIPSLFSLTTIAVGFYSWKARLENKIKLEIVRIQEEQKLKEKYKDSTIKINTELEENSEIEGEDLG